MSVNATAPNFVCYEADPDSPVTVQQGDVLGACVYDQSNDRTKALNIIGEVSDCRETLLSTRIGGCYGGNGIRTIQVSQNNKQFSTVKSVRLHLYAHIGLLNGKITILL